jgi:hypothetical protein
VTRRWLSYAAINLSWRGLEGFAPSPKPPSGLTLSWPPNRPGPGTMLPAMFLVSEADAAAIRTAYEQKGELSAAIEVRRLFPGVTDNARARECARSIAGWTPLPAASAQVIRLRPRGER